MIEQVLRALPFLWLLLASCDDVWDLEHVPPAPCTEYAIRDDFATGDACTPWGTVAAQDAQLMISASHMTITTSKPGGYGTCTAILPGAVPETGIFAEVSDMHGDAWLGIKGPTDRLLIYAGYGKLKLSTTSASFGSVDWDPVAMRWWRLRADPALDAYVGEYARDGKEWIAFGSAKLWPIEDAVQLTIGAGIADQATAQATTFEGLNVCPD